MENKPTHCLKKLCNREYKHPGLCNKKKRQCVIKPVCSMQDGHEGDCDEKNAWAKTPQVAKKKQR